MSFLQLRVNCADNSAPFYRSVAAPLQSALARQGYTRWTLARGWQHGPHFLLTFDTAAPGLHAGWLDEAQALVREFLATHPSTPVDAVRYRALQARLNDVEAAGIDPELVAPNDTLSVHPTDAARLAAKYESTAQWQSVFDTEARLRELVIGRWLEAERHEQFVAQMMVLLACVYPPVPSDDPARPEYDGFLSFHSNFVFWRHSLPAHQREQIDARFDTDYAAMLDDYRGWLAELPDAMTGQAALGQTARFMTERFAAFLALAGGDVIHARSPFARQQTAQRSSVSDFHKAFFYNADGSAYQFSKDFCAYRWLLNIVYKALPLLNIAPLRRQQFNQALDRLHLAFPDDISAIRAALPTGAA